MRQIKLRQWAIALAIPLAMAACQASETMDATTPPQQPLGLSALSSITWRIDSLQGATLPEAAASKLTLQLDSQASRISGSDGCNRFFGEATFTEPGQLEFGPLASTKRLCAESPTPAGFYDAFSQVRAYTLQSDNLLLQNEENQTLMTLSPTETGETKP